MTLSIISPIGGFGNHLRWLLLLDPRFKFEFNLKSSVIEQDYNNIKGESWPEFIDYHSSNVIPDVRSEILLNFDHTVLTSLSKHKFDSLAGYSNVNDKIAYIKNYIYPQNRTWHNWLFFEFTYRELLDDSILFSHSLDCAVSGKAIVIIIDPALALRTYIKFNSLLNELSQEQFIKEIELHNKTAKELADNNKNILLLDTGRLFNRVLDKELYDAATSWLELENFYADAKSIHEIWFSLHKKAEAEIISNLQQMFSGD